MTMRNNGLSDAQIANIKARLTAEAKRRERRHNVATNVFVAGVILACVIAWFLL